MMTNIFQNVFFLYYTVMRYIVATGAPSGSGVKTEVVDLSDPSKSCILEDIPYRYYSAGGLLGTTPVICGGRNYDGGWNYFDECLFYGTNHVITMNSKRGYHSSVALSDDRIWILGGYGSAQLIGTVKCTANNLKCDSVLVISKRNNKD